MGVHSTWGLILVDQTLGVSHRSNDQMHIDIVLKSCKESQTWEDCRLVEEARRFIRVVGHDMLVLKMLVKATSVMTGLRTKDFDSKSVGSLSFSFGFKASSTD